jgi:hypothetical protein
LGEGSVEGADGGDDAGGFEPGAGPGVEGEADAVGCFEGSYVPGLFLHGVVISTCREWLKPGWTLLH